MKCCRCGQEIEEGKEIFWNSDYDEKEDVVIEYSCIKCWEGDVTRRVPEGYLKMRKKK